MLVNTSNYNEESKNNDQHHQEKFSSGWRFGCAYGGNVALAADVPAGVTLAEKQTLVRNNGSEVQSLDPHKIEGVPESNISRTCLKAYWLAILTVIRHLASLNPG